MTMRAKFTVTKVEQTLTHVPIDKTKPWGPDNTVQREVNTVRMSAVTDAANASWARMTPFGELAITISNPDGVGFLKLGEAYFLDFTPAPAGAADEAKASG